MSKVAHFKQCIYDRPNGDIFFDIWLEVEDRAPSERIIYGPYKTRFEAEAVLEKVIKEFAAEVNLMGRNIRTWGVQ